jgi:predicted nucleic acid-binding protein
VTNPAVTGSDTRTRRQAWDLVEQLEAIRGEGLAPLWMAYSKRDDTSHLLWTDDYLAAFAQAAFAELVTLDRGLQTRYPSVHVLVLQ